MSDCCYDDSHDLTSSTPVYERKFTYKTLGGKDPRMVSVSDIFCSGSKSSSHESLLRSIKEDGCVQVFTGGTTSWSPTRLPPSIVKQMKKSTRQVPLYVHCPFTIDISKNDKAIGGLQNYLKSEPSLNKACILHMGYGTENKLGTNLSELDINYKTTLLLENSAGKNLGSSVESIRKVYEAIDVSHRISVCLDTQHLYASGLCRFESSEEVATMFDTVSNICGVPGAIHLNDSKVEYCSGKDRHECLREGHIWYESHETLIDLVDISLQYDIPLISETPDSATDRDILSHLV
jgi:endonuclease IV